MEVARPFCKEGVKDNRGSVKNGKWRDIGEGAEG